jgi:hypothetical protein
MMNKIICRGYRFPPEIIQRAIWLYYRFTLSLRDVDELLAERGIEMTLRDERVQVSIPRSGQSIIPVNGNNCGGGAANDGGSRRDGIERTSCAKA